MMTLVKKGNLPPVNIKTRKTYNGEQGKYLQSIQLKKDYKSNEWGTFLCWKQLGRSVNKGEKGITCFYPTFVKTNEVDKDGKIKTKKVRNYFTVFNFSQTSKSQNKVSNHKNIEEV